MSLDASAAASGGAGAANQPLVIDNGSGLLKAGLAGGDAPAAVLPALVGKPKHKPVMLEGTRAADRRAGDKAMEQRGLLRLRYPIERGRVRDWAAVELLWRRAYEVCKVHAPDEHPVLITESPLNPRRNRERTAQMFFELFGAPALHVSPQSVLSLYASGRTTGVVLDCGDGVSHCVPIVEGFAVESAVQRADHAGRDVTDYLQLLLRKQGHVFHTSAEREIVRNIKETCCYVSVDPRKDEDEDKKLYSTYQLPDGRAIDVGPECFRAPEALFRPDLVGVEYAGVHELLSDSIQRADIDLRRSLYAGIVLAGGSTLFSGFGQRLLNEVKAAAPKDVKIRISAPAERKYTTWIGGSILASLPTFKKMWVSRQEWEEEGYSALHRKSF